MTGLVRKATLFVACAALFGTVAAFAGIVSPGNCSLGATRINLVGTSTAASDPANAADSTEILSKLTITIRDIGNNPIAGVPVVLDFSGCTEVRVSTTQSYHASTGSCPSATVQGYTTANGTVSFVVNGGITTRSAVQPGHSAACMKIFADSYSLTPGAVPSVAGIDVGAFDENLLAGMNLADVSAFWADNGGNWQRTNVDGIGATVALADVSQAWAANGKFNTSAPVTLCP